MNGEPISLAEKIKRHRQSLGESQERFGERFGVQRLTVGNWERGTTPNGKHLTALNRQLDGQAEEQGESLTYQLLLPFDRPINLELRVSPQRADTIHLEVQLKRNVG